MKDYIKIDVVGSGKIDKYLANGWEIIETVKQEMGLDYHIGLPSRVVVSGLTAIIKDYEKHGFKELLFDKVAESFGENASDYETGAGFSTSDKTPRYIENYENAVNNKNVSVYKKRQDDSEDFEF